MSQQFDLATAGLVNTEIFLTENRNVSSPWMHGIPPITPGDSSGQRLSLGLVAGYQAWDVSQLAYR